MCKYRPTADAVTVSSGVPGPAVCIIGGVHGSERCGVELLHYFREHLFLKRGSVKLLYGNLRAIELGIRQTDANLNRMFRDDRELDETAKSAYEYVRSREMMKVMAGCDYCLDLHSSPTPGSPTVAVCSEAAFPLVSKLPIEIRCVGFETAMPGGTEEWATKNGIVAVGVECGQHSEPKTFSNAREIATAFLAQLGMVDAPVREYPQRTMKLSRAYFTKTSEFRVVKEFADFEPVKKGQLIARDSGEEVFAKTDGCVLFANDRDLAGVEGFLELTERRFF